MSRQVRMHWFHITFLFHFNRRMLPFRENAILISRFRANICTIQIGDIEGMWYWLGIWLFLLILLSHIDVFFFLSLSLLSQKWSLSGWWGAIDRLRKHILFCRAWQRLSCYLNNMSSAEVAQKIYLRNFYVVKSVGRREGRIYSPITQQKPQTVKAKAFHPRCNLFFSIILVTLKDILTKGMLCFV